MIIGIRYVAKEISHIKKSKKRWFGKCPKTKLSLKDVKKEICHIKKSKSRWFGNGRKTKLRQTNPNHRYFMRLIKKEVDDFIKVHGEAFKRENPAAYYDMIGRPLPKKYQKPKVHIAPVNAHLEPGYQTAAPSTKDVNDDSIVQPKPVAIESKAAEKPKPQFRVVMPRKDPNRGMGWVNPYTPINVGKLGSAYGWKKKDEDEGYY